jgi:hypothetical protein
MNIPSAEFVISKVEENFSISLNKLPRYNVFYSGVFNDSEEILICTPHSKLHIRGHGWIDITSKQMLLLKGAQHSVLAFRLEGNKVYYVNFYDLEKHLTLQSMHNNKKEGNHWKLYIWPKHIEIRGNAKHLLVEPNKLSDFII